MDVGVNDARIQNPDIYIAEPCSGLCHTLAIILHAFGFLVCTIMLVGAPIFVLFGLLFLLSLVLTQASFKKTARGLTSALLREDDSWVLMTTANTMLYAQYVGSPFATRALIILILQDTTGERWLLTLCRDNTREDTRRRLFVRIRYPQAD
jgi:hypothetical protein